MAPFYRGYESSFVLDNDDVTAIQVQYYIIHVTFLALFLIQFNLILSDVRVAIVWQEQAGGHASGHVQTPTVERGFTPAVTSRPDAAENNELCSPNVKVDTIFTGPDGKVYVFKGK